MKKDRFVAFFDAVMAIIMTIEVLQFTLPKGPTWNDLTELRGQIIVYALSFFWLGIMWISIHNLWQDVESLPRGVIFVNLCTLFFSSMIPFSVLYLSLYIYRIVPQILYGIDTICIALCNQISLELLTKENPKLSQSVKKFRAITATDISIKLIGIIVCVTVFPPAIMIAIFVSFLVMAIHYLRMKKRKE
ncbi:MAG: DUF1211 domain-containing protein [Clostridia bacterium]|nr:DUF1211 domain-containing protein [Clostridia bacterium]